MGSMTNIEWTDATWNPIRGCSRVSEGCRNCYAEKVAYRFSGPGQAYEGLAHQVNGHAAWTGKVQLAEEHLLDPLKWGEKKWYDTDDGTLAKVEPRRIFVNSMSDLFHENVPDEWIDRIFAVMELCPQHQFQILTKRPERMREYISQKANEELEVDGRQLCVEMVIENLLRRPISEDFVKWPLPNVWLGVSVEDQKTADERIPLLLQTPAAVRFISAEPLLGPVCLHNDLYKDDSQQVCCRDCRGIGVPIVRFPNWVICGGESGPGARPMHPDWARSLRDQCVSAGVPFFFKQWGVWAPGSEFWKKNTLAVDLKGRVATEGLRENFPEFASSADGWEMMHRAGKKSAGSLLDGVEWKQFPEGTR